MNPTAYELARCAACDGADTTVVAESDDVRAEVEALWAFHQRRLRARTPPERLVDRVAFSQDPPLRIVQCRACGLVYRNPRERAHALSDAYAEPPAADTLAALHDTQRRSYRTQAQRLIRFLGRRGTGIEVGSYVGAFLAAARDAGLQCEGVDVNPDVNAFVRGLGFVVHDGDLPSFAAAAGRRADAVAIWNCFDQLADPRATARAAATLLAPGGALAIRVPNGDCYARLRRRGSLARGFLAHNNLLGFPYRFGFTPSSLARLLAGCGFAVERVVGDVLVPTADEFTRPWARAEDRAVKLVARGVARLAPHAAPWFEVYARRQ